MFVKVVIHVRFSFCRFFEWCTLDPKIPTYCKFNYFLLLLVGIPCMCSLQTGIIIF